MTRHDDETLIRWSDGELPPAEAARLEAEAARDAELAGRMAALRRLRSAAREAFTVAPDLRDQDLARLIAADPAPRPSPIGKLGPWLATIFEPRRAVIWGGLATATFVGGLALGALLRDEPRGLGMAPDGTLTDRALAQVLDVRLAADGADAAGRSVGLSFQDGDRRWCRTFRAEDDGVAGLACRKDDDWAVRVLAPLAGARGEVRTAASETPEPVLAAVDATINGETADGATEARARDAGWR